MILVAVNKPGTNIYQFFNRKNGKVLSVSTKGQVGDWAEVWNRVPGFNPYQSFYIDTLANGNIVLCPVAFPNLVLNLPEGGRSTTYQRYTLWSKEDLLNGLNRQFRVDVLDYGADVSIRPEPVSNQSVSSSNVQLKNAPGVVTTASNQITNSIVSTEQEYEYWLIADNQKASSISSSNTSLGPILNVGGHSWVGLIVRDSIKYSDNTIDYTPWTAWKTWGFWGNTDTQGMQLSNDYEMTAINKIINSQVNGRYEVRKARVSKSRAQYIAANPGFAGCDSKKYGINTDPFSLSNICICTSFATRHWHFFTSQWEDFRPWGILDRAPADVARKIKDKNESTKSNFLDSGKTWD